MCKTTRPRYGSIRRLASGQWQVRWREPDGQMRSGGRTFTTEWEARLHLAKIHIGIERRRRRAVESVDDIIERHIAASRATRAGAR